jgi:septal ring factor EnvC (AmiA/AmiB activator)
MGRQERLKILLNQQDPATVSRVMVYYDYLNRVRAQKMQAIRAHMQRLAATEREIAEEEKNLAHLQEQQQAELAAMRLSQGQRQAVVARLTRELQDQGEQLDRLQNDERDLKTLISGLEQALSDIPAEHPQQAKFAGLRGKLPWPARGRISRRFGTPKLGSLVWDGVMISAPEGREVRAVHHGRVAFADWLRGFGLLLIVEHGDGYMTLYGHNQSLFKEAGDWVEVNEPIALVGSSGGREQAGVYFGIRHQGRAVNPARWCRRPTGRKVG